VKTYCQSCISSYYALSGICYACPWAHCLSCTGASQCLQCDGGNGWFWDPVSLNCVNTCPLYYRPNPITGLCERCTDIHCQVCTAGLSICNQCDTIGYYITGSATCGACLYQCKYCSVGTTCTTCYPGFNYQTSPSNACVGTCPSGQTAVAGVCTPCTDPLCVSCTVPANCVACQYYYYYALGGICYNCQANC
jgi:hypothetical protein